MRNSDRKRFDLLQQEAEQIPVDAKNYIEQQTDLNGIYELQQDLIQIAQPLFQKFDLDLVIDYYKKIIEALGIQWDEFVKQIKSDKDLKKVYSFLVSVYNRNKELLQKNDYPAVLREIERNPKVQLLDKRLVSI